MEEYIAYLQRWDKKHTENEHPMSYEKWEREQYFAEGPTEAEWTELANIYGELTNIAKEIEAIRIKLYNNRAHRNLNNENWRELDNTLFRIQSEIWSDENNGFGSYELSQSC